MSEEIAYGDEMNDDNSRAIALKRTIEKLQKKQTKLRNEISEKKGELRIICKHTETKTETKNYEGDYLNVSHSVIADICIVCGLTLREKIKSGTYA